MIFVRVNAYFSNIMFFLDWEKSYPLLRGIDSGVLCNTALAARPRVAKNEGVVSRVLRL